MRATRNCNHQCPADIAPPPHSSLSVNAALHEAGATSEDVIKTQVPVVSTQQSDLVADWEVVRDAFGAHGLPSTLVEVTVLGYAHRLVEVEAIAAVAD
ncbi:hypothetical protein GCM10027344_16660 [Spelaeicoccus albus]|uniref:Enamine deaminase RidA (YjgF/YER057c/UK114 family) n=1 Tax=Spelaeicoccus albus TaxID=1280376 RepID=A0A7Z0IIT3_9MICO|nr:enamine deaminase RidA (YjgF/YER057c/UK114 family) [Spelaeicoccus albus]